MLRVLKIALFKNTQTDVSYWGCTPRCRNLQVTVASWLQVTVTSNT